MSALACPFKPVAQRAQLAPMPHVHRFELETLTDDPTIWVQDCACGYRQRVRKVGIQVTEVFDDGRHGPTSFENSIFHTEGKGRWQDRWVSHS